MRLCLFEDASAHTLLPLTYFRPVYDLRCGMFSLRERIERYLKPAESLLHARGYLRPLFPSPPPGTSSRKRPAGPLVLVNGRVIMTAGLAARLRATRDSRCFVAGAIPVAAVLQNPAEETLASLFAEEVVPASWFEGLPITGIDAATVTYPWDLVYANEHTLHDDFQVLRKERSNKGAGAIHPSATLVQRRDIRLGPGVHLGAGVVLDATKGPIVIGQGATVFPNAVVMGPASVGAQSIVKIGAQIYGGTSIGVQCKVGGEVEEVIMHSQANKQHDGFLGHSYLCPWVNLGAGTTSSNLKNTYGSIRMTVQGHAIDTGRMFIGLFAGDHAKTGINVTLNTGTILGPSANIYGTTMPPREVPAFSWGEGKHLEPYHLDKALAVAETVMQRRGVTMTEAYRAVFTTVHSMAGHDRPIARD